MPKKKWEQLRRSGIRVGVFFPPFLGWLNLRVNYRNHRKIVIIDGAVGFVGGFNIGREYISKDPAFGYWRDTHLRITGEAVVSLQIRFALDWNYATGRTSLKMRLTFSRRSLAMGTLHIRLNLQNWMSTPVRTAARYVCRSLPAGRTPENPIYETTTWRCFTRPSAISISRPVFCAG